MQLKSDIVIDAGIFDPANNSEQANTLNKNLITQMENGVQWHVVGAAKYRAMRWAGETGMPPPTVIPEGINFGIPSREAGREIPCRVIYPESRKTDGERKQVKGTVLHFHGGGWTLGDERSNDLLLKFYADNGDLAVISAGYRHAPEDPFPRGPEDCIDTGKWMVKNSEKKYGAPLRFIGGESAGAHLTLITVFHLLKTNPSFTLPGGGLLLHFGAYDLSELSSRLTFPNAAIIPKPVSKAFQNAFLPGMSIEDRKDPSVSPYYEVLTPFRGRLPRALFTCGTEDPLIDDTVVMGTKWLMYGGEAYTKIYTGAPHAFIVFPENLLKETGMALKDTLTFIRGCLEEV